MQLLLASCLALALGAAQALAVPAPAPEALELPHVEVARAGVSTLSASQLSALAPYTQFARAAYCDSSIINGWQCGQACQANPGFQVTLTGGDGSDEQLFYVGYWPAQNSVVVAHQGTDPTQFLSDLTDADIFMTTLDPTLFPGISSSVEAHEGFVSEHALTASTILAETKRLISSKGATQVILVGHSLGGALAELDALFLKMNLPSSIHIKGVTYGTPRVGNPAYAALFDSSVSDFERINNESDPIPIVPGRFLGFQHVHGEIHIVSPGDAVSCPGDDDATDAQCTISTVPNIFDSDILDHLGPYQGIYIGTIYCT
ncbi:lipase [Phanerochaete sordida]|uniref:Lipase n=1 Tax=Phanerochaete sordida TaxID=48140 RepID=A0A9P3GMV0_9APHY|nr:lipase [Phanerochaete sordida]